MRIIPQQKVWMDGKFVDWDEAKIHVMTHGLHYGLAVFEGIRCYQTPDGMAFFRMRDHFQRLCEGTRVYRFSMDYGVDELCDAAKGLLRANGMKESYIRPIAFTGYGEISPDLTNAKTSVAICSVDFGSYFGDAQKTGISCMVSSWKRMNPEYTFSHVKSSSNYLNSAMAKKEALDAGYSESILLSHSGNVAEASGANIFLVRGGKLSTPQASDGILQGITRDCVIKIAGRMGLECAERSITRDELYVADEVFLCGTASEITPVVSIDRLAIGKGAPGPVTGKLVAAYSDAVRGRNEEFGGWLDFLD